MSTNKASEYYIIGMSGGESQPHLDAENGSPEYYHEEVMIEKPKKMRFKLGYPIPRKPKMVDYHCTPYTVISRKIQDAITSLKLKDVQLLPVVIKGQNDELYKDYALLHIYSIIPAMDKGKSIYKWMSSIGVANPIERLCLKNELLEAIPLEDRLIFRLAENTIFELYHQKVVDAIMATNPEGIRFTKVSDWNIGSAFE